jgi:hypothetical protein
MVVDLGLCYRFLFACASSSFVVSDGFPRVWCVQILIVLCCWRFVHALSSRFDVSDGLYLQVLLELFLIRFVELFLSTIVLGLQLQPMINNSYDISPR